jgi:hypothetical protein
MAANGPVRGTAAMRLLSEQNPTRVKHCNSRGVSCWTRSRQTLSTRECLHLGEQRPKLERTIGAREPNRRKCDRAGGGLISRAGHVIYVSFNLVS